MIFGHKLVQGRGAEAFIPIPPRIASHRHFLFPVRELRTADLSGMFDPFAARSLPKPRLFSTYRRPACNSSHSNTYAKTGGYPLSRRKTFKRYLRCRRADILSAAHRRAHDLWLRTHSPFVSPFAVSLTRTPGGISLWSAVARHRPGGFNLIEHKSFELGVHLANARSSFRTPWRPLPILRQSKQKAGATNWCAGGPGTGHGICYSMGRSTPLPRAHFAWGPGLPFAQRVCRDRAPDAPQYSLERFGKLP